MSRIHQLQNTRGKELSGVQITAYFLRIRVQPLQARKNPLWTYAGENDANRLSNDLSVKDLEKLIRRISSLSKRDPIPSSCRVEPYSSTNPLPENHPTMASLPPLPEGGDVEERAVVADDNQEAPSFVNEPADSRKSAGSIEKDAASEGTTSAQSPPPVVSPKNKRKRNDVEDSGTSQQKKLLLHRERQLMTHISRVSSVQKLSAINERANALAQKLEQSEEARKKAELDAVQARAEADKAKADAAGVEDLRKRLHTAETSLSDHIAAQSAREEAILKRIRTQSRRFVKDLGLKVRHENMKVAVENNVALVADSQQTIDWANVGDAIEQSRWKSLIKAAKPNTKKILAYLGIKPSSTPSSSRPEV
ncbi:hypothetical protein QYE76_015184 [Lolium multiflorum]|uniref:Uncharacterized protein n=1 Tax=Lolium multiflorum TaxID=4521 RepID=A0AAD8U6I3_LOLMU|nr:hypothetical protein QYE76_015184 [Lolium multiflorum]